MQGDLARAVCAAVVILCAADAPRAHAQDRVSDTVHNLSVSGPGQVRAQTEQRVCIFCHAPHSTRGVKPLWNRELPATSYQIYQSSTLDASPGQPTGSSKLCLSCHDGTIALGSVLNRLARIRMVGGDFMPAGLPNLGTDLSDDHPISFYYTSGLAASDLQLANPTTLPAEVKLDASGQLQCTSCHDPHHNRFGSFLVKPAEFGELCTACHVMNGWTGGSHRNSTRSVTSVPNGDWPFGTVEENACRTCHRSHTAGGHERLLVYEEEEANCLVCHNGAASTHNIESELNKINRHDPRDYLGNHDPAENIGSSTPHVECTDCHNPHAASTPVASGGYITIGATLAMTPGIAQGGGAVDVAQHEYEVCYRCHGDAAVFVSDRIVRLADTDNLRLRFSPTNPSYHPVVASVASSDTVSLDPAIGPGSLIRCTDCHNNDNGPRAGGAGPDGPHGSVNDFLLERNYNIRDDVLESDFEYAMCYKCHLRSSILSNQSFPEHEKHIVEERAPCSACHDPHGISSTMVSASDHTHLINFDTVIVLPSPGNGPVRFEDRGRFSGGCRLTCHGEDHDGSEFDY